MPSRYATQRTRAPFKMPAAMPDEPVGSRPTVLERLATEVIARMGKVPARWTCMVDLDRIAPAQVDLDAGDACNAFRARRRRP